MLKGTDKKHDLSEWRQPVIKIPAAVTCFPMEKLEKLPLRKWRDAHPTLPSFQPPKQKATGDKNNDAALIQKIIEADRERLMVRREEERCLNCGKERSVFASVVCQRCQRINMREVKRGLKSFLFDCYLKYGMISKEQQKRNDKRKGFSK